MPKSAAPRSSKRQNVSPAQLVPLPSNFLQFEYLGFIVAGVYCTLLSWSAWAYHVVGDYNVETDFYWSYIPEAKSILRGIVSIEDFHGPIYPAILGLFGWVTKDFFHSGVCISILSAGCFLVLLFYTWKTFVPPDIAFVGVILVAINSFFIQYSYTAGTDMFFNALLMASIYFLFKKEDPSLKEIAWSAFFTALAYLTRYNGVFMLLAIPVVFLIVNPFHSGIRRRFSQAAEFLAAFFLFIAPWGIYCSIEKGSFFYNKNYLNIAYEMFAKNRTGWDQFWFSNSVQYTSLAQVAFSNPVLFFRTVMNNVIEHYYFDMEKLMGWQMGVFVALGLLALWKRRPTRKEAAFWIVGVSFFCVLLLVFYGERFSLFLIPFYISIALFALSLLQTESFRAGVRVRLGMWITVVLAIWTLSQALSFNRTNIDSGPKEVLAIAEWFHQNVGTVPDTTVIVARKPHISYYLGMSMTVFPNISSMEELYQSLRQSHAQYLYFGVFEANMRPQFQRLLNPLNAPGWLIPLTYTVDPPAVLYRVSASGDRAPLAQ